MSTLVISYRRTDSKWITGRIFEHLENHFGAGHVFMDVDHIPPGEDFREHIRQVLDNCDLLVAIVGPEWHEPDKSGKGRLFHDNDWVRVEISIALGRKIPVVPVLLDGTKMPNTSELPAELVDFAFRQAITFNTEDFKNQMQRLIRSLDRLMAKQKQSRITPVENAGDSSASENDMAPLSHHPTSSARHQKASSPRGRIRIYISYSWDDDVPPPDRPDRKGFVTFLDESLRYELRDLGPDRPQIWRDAKRISHGDQFTPEIETALKEASLLVVVLSPNWMASKWCNWELESFAKYHGPDGISERIIVVGKRYLDPNRRPPLLQGQTGFEFYARNRDPDDIAGDTEFFDRGEPRDERYWQKVRALTTHLLKLTRPTK